jgi:hypothetical protein
MGDKHIEDIEKDYEYLSEEESVFNSFIQDVNLLPQAINKNFAIASESK